MVALFLVCYFLLTIVLGWKINKSNNKLRSEILKCSEELKKCVEEKDAVECKLQSILADKRSSKKLCKEKSRRLRGVIRNKEEMIRVLEEQLAIAQSTDRGLREANLRLSNQLGEANSLITELRGEW